MFHFILNIVFMKDLISKGYSERVPAEDLGRSDGEVWYIPHHGVYHPRKGKLRVVFDCGAKFQGTSLNTQLLQGPDLTSSPIGVINVNVTRFRKERVVIMADIEATFHQVRVPKDDTDLLRFLWWHDGDLTQDMVEYVWLCTSLEPLHHLVVQILHSEGVQKIKTSARK